MRARSFLPLALLAALFPARAQSVYEADVRFATEAIEKNCGELIASKAIEWRAVSAEIESEAKGVESPEQHLVLLTKLLARLRDGHAEVRPLDKGKDIRWPDDGKGERTGPGMFLCRSGNKILVKNAWSAAAQVGIEPGTELVSVDGAPAAEWLAARIAARADLVSFSTAQHAFYDACHRGLAEPAGTRLELELKDAKGKKKKRTLTYTKANPVPWGPSVFPPALAGDEDVRYGKTAKGFGYVHLRRAPEDLPERMDAALAALEGVPGLILDFRANGGGGFDHEAFMGRFVPSGKSLAFARSYASAGPHPYGGRIVAIVDAGALSAGETASGMFKEDGRAYLIGESATAGMSSQKTTIELPSGLFALYVSTGSNMQRANGGRGLEGLGVSPHELVEYQAKDLAEGVDTLIRRAEELLAKFPKSAVPYDPADFGSR